MYQYLEVLIDNSEIIVEDGKYHAMFVVESNRKWPVVGIIKQTTPLEDGQFLIQSRIQLQFGHDIAPMSLLHEGSLLAISTSILTNGERYKGRVVRRWFEPALRTSWQNTPIPDDSKIDLKYERVFTQKEFDRIKLGEIPESMDDHCFAYFENNCLYWFRSWTGIGIFELYLEPLVNGWRVIKAIGNNDPAFDARLISVERLSGLMDGLIWHGNQIFDI